MDWLVPCTRFDGRAADLFPSHAQSPSPSQPTPSSDFLTHVKTAFGSIGGLVSHFSAHVAGLHPSSGAYVWLVTDPSGNLGVVGTYAGGTVLLHQRQQKGPAHLSSPDRKILGEVIEPAVEAEAEGEETEAEHESVWKSAVSGEKRGDGGADLLAGRATSGANALRMSRDVAVGKTLHPLLCLSVHPHCYLEDYGVWGREEYVRNWWEHVNWPQVEAMFAEYKAK